jgi:hypothetical protein
MLAENRVATKNTQVCSEPSLTTSQTTRTTHLSHRCKNKLCTKRRQPTTSRARVRALTLSGWCRWCGGPQYMNVNTYTHPVFNNTRVKNHNMKALEYVWVNKCSMLIARARRCSCFYICTFSKTLANQCAALIKTGMYKMCSHRMHCNRIEPPRDVRRHLCLIALLSSV